MKNKSLLYKLFIGALVGVMVLVIRDYIGGIQSTVNVLTAPPPSQTQDGSFVNTATTSPFSILTDTRSTPTSESTWTPAPTINPEAIDIFIDSVNSECELPCWGNINPGITSEAEAKYFLSSFGTIIESTSTYFYYRDKPTVIDLAFMDGLVFSINLPPELTESYELGDLLSRYGMPDEVKIEIIPETADGTSWFFLSVFFPEDGFFAVYSGDGTIINSKVNACFENVFPDLYLFEPNKYSLEQAKSFFLDPFLQNMLESLTETNKSQFYDVFSQEKEQCLATMVQAP